MNTLRLFALFSLAFLPLSASAARTSSITVKGGYVRAVPVSSENTAAHFSVSNTAKKPVSLLTAESPIARAVELHEHLHENGMMKMVQVKAIEVPAEGSVELEPMGYHLMLIGLKKEFRSAKDVSLKLRFSDGSVQSLSLPIKKDEE